MFGLIQYLVEKRKKKATERNQRCQDLIARLSHACDTANGYTQDKRLYVDVSIAAQWEQEFASLQSETDIDSILPLKKADGFSTLISKIKEFHYFRQHLQETLNRHNEQVAAAKLKEAYALIGKVEGRTLDQQQMMAIMQEAHNQLIIAGAGTGKTTTVVGKIKYLLKSGKCRPEDILVLSFTNASAAEMSERIAKETGCQIAASTFHKLGVNIITKANGIKPRISRIDLRAFIRERMKGLMKDRNYVRALNSYLFYNRIEEKTEFDFKNEEEYRAHFQLNPPVTFQNERVKSYGEMDIANYLFQNGISYEYEAKYKIDTRTAEYGQYYPDFFLPDYGIYIEYFAINREGSVPEWFSGKNGLSPTQTYRESMEWKRRLHQENETVLIECFAYEKLEENLLPELEKKLLANGVKLFPKTPQELWAMVSQNDKTVLDGIIELFETVINLIKSNRYTIHEFRALAGNGKNASRCLNFIVLLEPLFTAYEEELKKTDEIDFNDMINIATDLVRNGKVVNPFSQVIVDEYQDISKARFSLLSALRMSRYYDLFCVGDDWQSIYRFAGSDISFILDFEKYWGPTAVSRIETTYRFTPSLIEISGSFIMKNPRQIRKRIRGTSTDRRFSLGEINAYNEKYAVEFMAAKLEDLPQNSSVFFIGRYSFDLDIIGDSGLFDCRYNNASGFVDVKSEKRPDLKMCFLTAHKSKGLQADYVFIINNKSSRMGFPSMIQDDPILDLLLENREDYPFAEERRLYYVALTRAKTKAFFLTVKDKESVFAQELHLQYGQQLKREQFECPICGGGLKRKSGPYGDFFGCENYRTTGCRYKRRIRSKTEPMQYE